jgi:hypothetical protein
MSVSPKARNNLRGRGGLQTVEAVAKIAHPEFSDFEALFFS